MFQSPHHPGGSLVERYATLFPASVRRAGDRLAGDNRVAIVRGTSTQVQAVVLDRPSCRVDLQLVGHSIRSSCACDIGRHGKLCPHVWAVLARADGKGLLAEFRAPGLEWRGGGNPVLPRANPSWRHLIRAIDDGHRRAERFETGVAEGGELLYAMDPARTLTAGELVLRISMRKRRKNGSWGNARPRTLDERTIARVPDAAERRALELLVGAENPREPFEKSASEFSLNEAQLQTVLPELCRTGRLFLSSDEDEAPAEPCGWDDGEPWQVRLRILAEETRFVLRAVLERGDESRPIDEPLLFLAGGLFFTKTQAARYAFDGDFAWIPHLRQQPRIVIPRRDLPRFLKEAYARPGRIDFELPADAALERVRLAPRPKLGIRAGEILTASLSFAYDGLSVAADESRGQLLDDAGRRLLIRDPAAERSARALLPRLGFEQDPEEGLSIRLEKLPAAVVSLVAAGWEVEGEDGVFRAPSKARIEVSSGIDWFEVTGGVRYGNQAVALPALLEALRAGKKYVKLGDGSAGLLPEEWLKRQGLFLAAGEADGERLKFTKGQVALLDAMLESEQEATTDEAFRRVREGLSRFEGVDAAPEPAGFRGTLREYQRVGLGWLGFLGRSGLGGCLADDMGLGKTIQVLAYLETRRQASAGPSLVVVPRSLLFNWKAEAASFAPSLRVREHWGALRGKDASAFRDADLVLTTYGTLRRDAELLQETQFDCIVLDEAQAIKNPESDTAKSARLLRGGQRLAMSGTPIENHLGELWSLMEFLNPGLLGRSSAFTGVAAAGGGGDAESRARLAKALRPFILRRTKAQVAPELPARVEQTILVELDGPERRRYDELKKHYQQSLLRKPGDAPPGRKTFHVLEALLRLRQASCHPGLIDKALTTESSSKLEILIERLREVVEEGHKALVFSQFTSLLAIVKRVLGEQNIAYEYLDGKTQDRGARVRRFQEDPACPVFLVSLKAGGVGLNLTAAEYVFLLDPWWNPAVEAQAIDRTHRIGQTRRVIACRLVAKDTVEEKVLELQQTKRELADAILGADGARVSTLTRDDLERLLS